MTFDLQRSLKVTCYNTVSNPLRIPILRSLNYADYAAVFNSHSKSSTTVPVDTADTISGLQ